MNFLPVVERELRVRSRRTAFYWERLALAGVMLVVMLWFLATMAPFSRGAGMGMLGYGRHIFLAMSWVAFVVVVVGGVMETADCVSREKRDGTLGLLFLTDLRGLDVGLGKLTARSLTAFFGLLGAIPMLALPVMMGGVTGAEVVRVALVLVVAQMFSLTAGLLASTLCRSAAQAVGLAMSLVMVLNIIVPMVAASSEDRLKALFVACPGFALYRASEGGGPEYWTTVGIAAAMAGLFFAVACLLLPSSWQDRPGRQGKGTWSARMTQWTYGTGEARAGRRRSLLEINPILWLSSRERMRDLSPWFGLALVAGMILLVTSLIADDWREALRNFLNPFAVCFYAFCFHLLLKVKVCSDAARRFAEDRESGAIELLVATPMKTSEILKGHYQSLRRRYWKPVVFVLATDWVLFSLSLMSDRNDERGWTTMTLLCLCGTFLVDLWALSRAGTWFGLERRSAVKGARAAQFRILLAPVLVWWFLMCLGGNAGGTLVFYVVTSVLFAGGMGVSAEARTRRHFRLLAANSATPWKQLKGDDWKDWGVEPEDGS